jgi:hypothetical protein
MDSLIGFLNANFDGVIALLGMIVTGLVTLIKGTAWLARVKNSFQKRGMETAFTFALELVQDLYEESVRALKDEGKFDATAKAAIKVRAVNLLKEKLKTEGVSLAKELVPTLIELAIKYLKGKGVVLPFSNAPGLAYS